MKHLLRILLSLLRPKDSSLKELYKTVAKAIIVTPGVLILLVLTIVWGLAMFTGTVTMWMIEDLAGRNRPQPPKGIPQGGKSIYIYHT